MKQTQIKKNENTRPSSSTGLHSMKGNSIDSKNLDLLKTNNHDPKEKSNQQLQTGTPLRELLSNEIIEFYSGFDKIVLNNDIGAPQTEELARSYALPYGEMRFLKFDEKLGRERCLAFIYVSAFKKGELVGPLKTGMPKGTGFGIKMTSIDNLIDTDDMSTTRGKSVDGSYDVGSALIVAEKPIEECIEAPLVQR